MDIFTPRKIKFKAWNTESRLLMRLNSIDCLKGELHQANHIFLQFTSLYDKEGAEIYELDVLLEDYTQYVVFWNHKTLGWNYAPMKTLEAHQPLSAAITARMKRFCNYYELR